MAAPAVRMMSRPDFMSRERLLLMLLFVTLGDEESSPSVTKWPSPGPSVMTRPRRGRSQVLLWQNVIADLSIFSDFLSPLKASVGIPLI